MHTFKHITSNVVARMEEPDDPAEEQVPKTRITEFLRLEAEKVALNKSFENKGDKEKKIDQTAYRTPEALLKAIPGLVTKFEVQLHPARYGQLVQQKAGTCDTVLPLDPATVGMFWPGAPENPKVGACINSLWCHSVLQRASLKLFE